MTDITDADHTLRTVIAHRDLVRLGLLTVVQDLQRRALSHDVSKLREDEFAGFTRINRAARKHPYGSDEYRAGLRAERETIKLHYSRNSHHPEHHLCEDAEDFHHAERMGFLDIIEMVCDWRGAYLGYGSQGSWEDNILRQRERYRDWFTEGQWWLIEQVAELVGKAVECA